ncbi:MAG: 2-oxo acid dehydrogenase subunit E2, partial [Dehalococcoidia bacterium]|nr:2-oxo acid dehydrogenase subunit E2 [Dehalococcoidia bacterium]
PPPPPADPARVEPLSRMRAAIARNMSDAKQQQPHYYLTVDVDMTEAMSFRRHVNLVLGETQRVSVNDLIVRACAVALLAHPKFNASLTEEGIQYHQQIDINIGVALDEGLIAPALLDVAPKGLPQIAEESKALVERARAGKLRAEEYSSGTFTITNLGAYGIDVLVGIINAGQAAILGAGSVTERPAVVDGEIAPRQLMTLALSADHRVSDGAEGARFLKEIQTILENPTRLSV